MLEINADNEVRRSNCEITPAAIPVIETYPAQDAVRVVPFDGHPVRTGGDPKNPWFCVLDVLKAIDDKPREGKKYNVTEATKDLDEDELILNELVDIRGKKQVMQCVYKSGLFYLVGNSRKPSSMRFKRWVRKEVLVEIDQTGSYNGGAQLTVQRRDPMAIIERIADLATNDHVQAMELRNNMSALAATMTMLSGILAKQDALIKAEIGNVQAKVDHTSSVQSALIAHTNDRFAGIDGEINALKQAQYTVPRFVPTSRPIVPTMTVPPPTQAAPQPAQRIVITGGEPRRSVKTFMEENEGHATYSRLNRSLVGRRVTALCEQHGIEPVRDNHPCDLYPKMTYPSCLIKEACRQLVSEGA